MGSTMVRVPQADVRQQSLTAPAPRRRLSEHHWPAPRTGRARLRGLSGERFFESVITKKTRYSVLRWVGTVPSTSLVWTSTVGYLTMRELYQSVMCNVYKSRHGLVLHSVYILYLSSLQWDAKFSQYMYRY